MSFKQSICVSSIISALFLCSCVSWHVARIQEEAGRVGLNYVETHASPFLLATWSRVLDNSKPLNVYIEGDGYAFDAAGQATRNPTPNNPLALKLATLDTAANILYIARPYQFVAKNKPLDVIQKYWTTHRFSEEVISSINEVITRFRVNSTLKEIKLIGYSGGGAIATLIAARRKDVNMLVTIAGNLDHIKHSTLHAVPQLKGSLNPCDLGGELKLLKQIHFIGERDTVVPKEIIFSFQAKTGIPLESMIVVKNVYHQRKWEEIWPILLERHVEN